MDSISAQSMCDTGHDDTESKNDTDEEYLRWKERGREQRKAKKESQRSKRYEILAAMGKEQRAEFLQRERTEAEHRESQLKHCQVHGQRVVIDLNYDNLMTDKEIRSLVIQIVASYATIKRMEDPFHLVLTSCTSRVSDALKKVNVSRWYATVSTDAITDIFTRGDLVYLTPDSDNVIEALERDKVYVIGGIVDRSRAKGQSLSSAMEKKIQTARLPIQEHIPDRLDHILNVNTVVDILANFQKENNWEKVLKETLPKRKQDKIGNHAKRKLRKQHPPPLQSASK